MRAGGGKQKGADYERKVCVDLSKWISGGKRQDLFWRSAMSGGRATLGKRKGIDLAAQAGDITATHIDGHVLTDHYLIECKRYADLNFGAFLTKGVGPLAQFWKIAVAEATKHDRIAMLIVREDRNDTILMVPNESMLKRGVTAHRFGLNPNAFIARMMKLNVDMYSFADVLLKPFEAPAKYDPTKGPMLKPGELAAMSASTGWERQRLASEMEQQTFRAAVVEASGLPAKHVLDAGGAPYGEGEAPAPGGRKRGPKMKGRRTKR